MLRFKFYQFELDGRFYVPLPKMTSQQMGTIARRLGSIGFGTSLSVLLLASAGSTKVTVDPKGLCSSNRDLTDAIAPVIPHVLSARKQRVSARLLRDAYFMARKEGDEFVARLSPRMESSSLWERLRAADSCALTPDERAVYSLLLSSSENVTPLLTDFPTEGCRVTRIGKTQYYESNVDPLEAASTLREIGLGGRRNTYLPRTAFLRLGSSKLAANRTSEALGNLGEWCFLSPP